jgi:hypothetical protein
VSRPRRPFSNPPGRLPATMLKVLAAELSDAGRLTRGKQYWSENAVVDIVVGHGVVTAEVQGSRSQPYVVTIETEPGTGTPAKLDLWVQCTCPDDTGTGVEACKHAVAALFALSDEVAVEPELLDRWRAGRRRGPAPTAPHPDERNAAESPPAPTADRPSVRPLRLVHSSERAVDPTPPTSPAAPRDRTVEQIAAMLAAPGGAAVPSFPELGSRDHHLPAGRLWADTLASALTEFERLAWD